MSKSAQSNQAAQARGIRRFVPTSIKPIVVKLTRKLSVTYWPGRRRTVSATLLALLAGFVHSLAAASPTGERVVSGSAVVSRPNASTTLVTQGSQNAIINWQSFSIGAGEGVRFVQPSASAVALNRVVGNDPSRIFGSLSSNGKVFLVNTAGVYFAPGASVDVGGLVASSMRISDANFNAGNYKFEGGAGAGAVDNQGMLRGAFVVLAAPQVSNSGSIVTTGGSAALAAGGRVSLDIAGDKLVSLNVDAATANAAVVNSGSISADGGKVFMSAHSANAVLDTVINTSGVVRANSIGMRDGQIVIDGGNAGTVAVSGTLAASGAEAGAKGGSVAVLGDRVSLQTGANVDVSGDAGGGSARIGGDFHGAGALKTASQTQVEKGASINADAITSGNGGTVAVWSDQHTGFAGSISAKGGAQGGDGGFVETSGKRTLAFSGKVSTTAAHGTTGTLLLDPTDITISSDSSSSDPSTGTSILNSSDLSTALDNNNVIVDTVSGQSGSGNITVNDAVTWSQDYSLTLKAVANITVNQPITSNGGNGAINLNGDGAIVAGTLISGGGKINIAGNGGGSNRAGSVVGTSIVSNGGDVSVYSRGAVSTGSIHAGTGTITIDGQSDVAITGALTSGNSGTPPAIVVNAGSNSSAGSAGGGDITVSGSGSVNVAAGQYATLYTGSVAGSTGLTGLVGAGSGMFRYGSDANIRNFSADLTPGVSAVYREQPTVTIPGSSISMFYGTAVPALSPLPTGLVNGDTNAQALSGALTLSVGGSTSSSGLPTVGAHPVTASGISDQLGYHVDYALNTLNVQPKALSMSGLSVPASKVYDGSTTAVVSGAPTLAVSEAIYSGSGSDGKSYIGDVVALSGTASGTYNSKNVVGASSVTFGGLTLAGADASNYILTLQPALAATITPAPLTATATAPNKVYDGTTVATPTFSITAGLAGTETVNVIGSASFNTKDVATANVVTVNSVSLTDGANGGLASNYSIASGQTAAATITPAVLTASVSAPDKVYDATTTAAAPLITVTAGLVGGETVAVSSTTANFNSKDVLSANQVTVNGIALADGTNGGLASNYSLATSATATAHIIPKALTATITAPNKAYDGTTAATPTVAITGGFVGTETVSVASGTASFNSKDVLTATTVTLNSATLADGSNGGIGSNYSIAPGATTNANITPATLSASVSAPDKVYDGTVVAAPVVTLTGGLVAGESLGVSATGSFNSKNVLDAHQVTVDNFTLADGAGGGMTSNYYLPAVGTAVAHITPKGLSASFTATDKTYDGTTAAVPTVAITGGFVGTETVSLTGSAASFNSKDVLTANTVTLDNATLADGANGGLASNYSIASGATTTAHITPAVLTATVSAPDKVYDATTAAAPVVTLTGGFVAGETVVVSGAIGSFNTSDVLTANQVTVDSISLANGGGGGLASNYSLSAGQVILGTQITPKTLSMSGLSVPASKVYDANTAALVSGTATLQAAEAPGAGTSADGKPYIGDGAAIVGTPVGTYNSQNVADASSVTYSGLTLAGPKMANYTLAIQAPSAATISQAHITSVSSLLSADKVYDGNTTAALNSAGAVFNGVVAGDVLAIAGGTANFSDRNVGAGKTVSISGFTLAGTTASNYTLDNNTATTTNSITRLPSVTYIGASGGDWASAANWQGGALPDAANVAKVVIPAGKTVNFTNAVIPLAGSVQLDNIEGGGTLNVGGGALTVAQALNAGGYSQTGGAVLADSMTGASFSQTGGTLNVAHSLNTDSYAQSGGSTAAGSATANTLFNQTGGTLAVTGALDIQQAAGTVSLGDLTAGTVAIGGGAGVRQADGTAVAVQDGITLATGAGDVSLGNANNAIDKVTVDSVNNFALATNGGLTFVRATVGGAMDVVAGGPVSQTGALSVSGASNIAASGQDVSLGMATNDFGGALTLTAGTAAIKDANALTAHLSTTGATSLASATGLIVDGTSGALTTDSASLAFGPTTVIGALGATSRGAVSQTGALSVSGASNITASGQHVSLGMASNDFGGALTLAADTATINANTLTVHLNTTGAASLASVTGLAVDGSSGALTTDSAGLAFGPTTVTGALGATSRGAVSQTGALSVSGATNIAAAGHDVSLGMATNDFGGALTLAAGTAAIKDANALTAHLTTTGATSLASVTGLAVDGASGSLATDSAGLAFGPTTVTGALGATSRGAVSQTGKLSVSGASNIAASGQDVSLGMATNDFGGALTLAAGTATIKDANTLAAHLTTTGATSLASVTGLAVDGSSGALTTDSAGLAFGPTTVTGALGATSRGAVSQTGALAVTGTSNVAASGQDVSLGMASNDFGGALTLTAGTATIKDANALTAHLTTTGATSLASITGLAVDGSSGALSTDSAGLAFGPTTVTGALGATSRGAVSQTGKLSVSGASNIAASGQDVSLGMATNDFGGALTLTAGTATIKDANALAAHLTTTGATSLASVTSLAVDGSSGALTTDSAGLAFGATTVTGALGATSRGAVSQTGALAVTGTSNIAASGQDVSLAMATNDFRGALTLAAGTAAIKDANNLTAHLTTTGATSLASVTSLAVDGSSGALTTDSVGLAFGPTAVSGTLGATSRGAVSQTGALSVSGLSNIAAAGQDVSLGMATNDFGGALTLAAGAAAIKDTNALTAHLTTTGATSLTSVAGLTVDGSSGALTTDSASLAFGPTSVIGTLGATSRGAVSQTGALSVSGLSNISAAGQDVSLGMATNDFGGALILAAGTAAIKDANSLTAHLTTTGATSLASVTGLAVDGSSGALTTDSAGLAFGPTTVSGALGATSRGAVSQTGALSVSGATNIAASGQDVSLGMATNDFGGALTLAAGAAAIKDANALTAHLTTTGATSLASVTGLAVDGASGSLATDSAGLAFGPTTVTGALGATSRGAVSQTGKLSVSGASNIAASGQDVSLGMATNDFGGALTLAAGTATIKDANTLAAHLTTTGATSLASVTGLAVDGSSGALTTDSAGLAFGPTTVTGALGATSRGAVSQTGALAVTGTSNIAAAGQAVTLNDAGNDFGGAVALSSSAAKVTDKNQLSISAQTSGGLDIHSGALTLGATGVTGDLSMVATGAISQTGALSVTGNSNILATGQDVALAMATNDFGGGLTLAAGTATIKDANALAAHLTTTGATSLASATGLTVDGNSGSLATDSSGLTFGTTKVTGALAAGSRGAVGQTGSLTVTGASNIAAAGQTVALNDVGNDFGGALTLAAGTATIKDANALAAHLATTGATSLTSVAGLTVDGGSGALTTDSAGLAFGPTTVTGALGATSRGAVSQTGALAVTGTSNIVASGQDVSLGMATNDFGGALTLAANTAMIKDANVLAAHLNTTGATSLSSVAGLTADGSSGALTTDSVGLTFGPTTVTGTLGATSRGAVAQTGALVVTGTSNIAATGQAVTLNDAGNDFGGDVTLAADSAKLADKNALSFASADVTGNLQAGAKGDVTQKGIVKVGGTTSIDTTGAVNLANAANDFVGAVSATGSNVTLRDANLITVGKITAPQVDLTAGYGLQMTGSGIIDSPKVSLALTQFTGSGSIGTATLPFKVKDNANVTLGALTPAVPAFFGGSGVQVSVTNGVALREYSRELVALYLGNSKPYNRVLDDFVSQNIVSLSKILRDAQKKADSSTDLIDNGMPIDLTERAAYPHAGSLKLKEPCKDRKDCK
ncbi:YDG domain-containing protein [Massilia sp. R2A-15]|uniref:YDG domain-containing protein n=1 Tax=Massilia sp. R2A-15 TaxID=3064278 RepID=UPI0027342470|nr:YDG domain-containing protein [Massilia sp. R2A-15]WLI89445.1 YDG domain-containing protein [Massilia sp. R2A-15]